jgi:two-component system OmpR family sensor kinase
VAFLEAVDARRSDQLLATLEHVLELDAVDLRTALAQAADVVAAALGADKVDVFVHDAASDSLVALGISATPMGEREKAAGLDRLPLSNGGRAAAVYRCREPFLSGDSRGDDGELRALAEVVGVRSTMMVPVDYGGDGAGVLNVNSAEVDRFGPADLDFARAIARWIGLVGHRAKLTERIAAAAREEGRRGAAEELVTVVAHDVRNFLSPALGRVQLMRRRAERDGRAGDARDAAAAERSLARVTRLVGDLLDVARLDQGLFELSPSAIDLVELIREVAATHEVPGKEIAVRAPGDVVLTADEARLRQVLDNLLANALTHAAAATPVVVDVTHSRSKEGEWAEVVVANQGPPIPPEVAPRIFSRFVRGESGSSGLGLGLYLAREIVTAHGGTIALEPVTDGARFRIRLPVR